MPGTNEAVSAWVKGRMYNLAWNPGRFSFWLDFGPNLFGQASYSLKMHASTATDGSADRNSTLPTVSMVSSTFPENSSLMAFRMVWPVSYKVHKEFQDQPGGYILKHTDKRIRSTHVTDQVFPGEGNKQGW